MCSYVMFMAFLQFVFKYSRVHGDQKQLARKITFLYCLRELRFSSAKASGSTRLFVVEALSHLKSKSLLEENIE